MLNLILRTLLALSFVFTASAYGQNEIFYNDLKIGREQESDISIEANIGRTNNPQFRYNATLSEWEFSDDGVTFISLSDLLVDISGKADINSPSFTGAPSAPTPSTGDDSSRIATTEFVQDAIANFGGGDVEGPDSSVDSSIALFDGVTGKLLKDSSVTVDSNGSITAGSLWLGSNSQILSSSGTITLGNNAITTRTLGNSNSFGIVTSNTTIDGTTTGNDALLPVPTTKIVRLTNPSLYSIYMIEAGVNTQELSIINSVGRDVFIKPSPSIATTNNKQVKIPLGMYVSLVYDSSVSKWIVGEVESGGITEWTPNTPYFLGDIVTHSSSIYKAVSNNNTSEFNLSNWDVISYDTAFGGFNDIIVAKNILTRNGKTVRVSDDSIFYDMNDGNLLINSTFEASYAPYGWTVTSLASADEAFSDFDGEKKVCLSGLGSIYQIIDNTDRWHGRQFIARLNIQNPAGREAQVCLYDGEDLHKCIDIVPSTEFREYVIQDTFIEGKTFGVIITGNELDGICTDMNSVKLDENEAYVANIEGDYQQVILSSASVINTSTDLDALTKSMQSSSGKIFSLSTEGLKVLRKAKIEVTASGKADSSSVGARIYLNGVELPLDISKGAAPTASFSSLSLILNKDDILTFNISGTTQSLITISATARSQVINYPDETFSTDINPVYWKATPCGEDEIGCYNTYPFTSDVIHGAICTVRPDQTDAEIRIQGFRSYSRSFGQTRGCATPSAYRMIIGKGLSSPSLELYKNANKTTSGTVTYAYSGGAGAFGAYFKDYDSKTGVFYFNSGVHFSSSATGATFRFEDGTNQDNGYLVISATKNGGALVNKSPRTLVKVSDPADMPSWYEVYSDGWVRQGSYVRGGGAITTTTVTWLIPMRDTNYSLVSGLDSTSENNGIAMRGFGWVSKTTTNSVMFVASTLGKTNVVEGYGAASYLLENFGIKVNY